MTNSRLTKVQLILSFLLVVAMFSWAIAASLLLWQSHIATDQNHQADVNLTHAISEIRTSQVQRNQTLIDITNADHQLLNLESKLPKADKELEEFALWIIVVDEAECHAITAGTSQTCPAPPSP